MCSGRESNPNEGVKPNFVAMTTSSRTGASARPSSFSPTPQPYISAVSNIVTPSSWAFRMAAIDSVSSAGP